MNTLTEEPTASLLQRLFVSADEADVVLRERFSHLSEADRRAALGEGDYRGFYAQMKDCYLAVSPETGRLLYLLARASGARTMVEFGTSFGLSTIHLASAAKDNGGGRVIGSELEADKASRARANLEAAGLATLVEIRVGDALETLGRDLPAVVDLVLLDGAKMLYGPVLDLLEPRLRPGAIVLADNADMSPAYLERVRGSGAYLSLPFAADVELSVKV